MFSTGGSTLAVYTTDDLSSANQISISQQTLASSTSGVGVIIAGAGTTTAATLASVQLSDITNAIQNVATMRAVNGAEQSRLNFASTLLTTNETNLQAANSSIKDVDVAQETTNLAKWNVLVQAGASMLTQANQSSQIALKLITG
jgi:flagellin